MKTELANLLLQLQLVKGQQLLAKMAAQSGIRRKKKPIILLIRKEAECAVEKFNLV